jgi:hypothetical protein
MPGYPAELQVAVRLRYLSQACLSEPAWRTIESNQPAQLQANSVQQECERG